MSSPLETLGLPGLPTDLERVEQGLRDAVRHADPFLGEVAGHLVGAGGKRLRPALTVCAAYAARGAGAASAEAIAGGCSVELVHLGSLYHDDVIDEAETRRGVESVNSRWSNIVAILAGDFLLARASEIAASLGADVAALLAATIGELCRGQVLELQNLFNREHEAEAYLSAIAGKTASLFATACRIGGMVSEVDEPTLDALTSFGDHLGMCFQIVDDILDRGHTLAALRKELVCSGVAKQYTAALVVKRVPRASGRPRVDFAGLTIDDVYVFGCGMDYRGYWRELRALYAVDAGEASD